MLLIGDIHITSRYKDAILDGLRTFVANNQNEKDIVFFGDYVYHFSYDRSALLSLYNFFLELFEQGKSIYIMSGNHDWIGDSFVFQEAQQAFASIKDRLTSHHSGQLMFITEPQVLAIQGRNILFLPRTLNYQEPSKSPHLFGELISSLKNSKSLSEQRSGLIDHIVVDALEKHGPLVVFHHHYFNNTRFPGQKSIFRYQDIALTEQFFEVPELSFVSGHLHQSFTHKNYLCLGNIRASSPLESNQNKFLFVYHPADNSIEGQEIVINPYLHISSSDPITPEFFEQSISDIQNKSASLFEQNSCWIVDPQFISTKAHQVQLTVIHDNLSYDDIESHIDPNLLKSLKNIQLKRNFRSSEEILEDLQVSAANLSTGFADCKILLQNYLEKKYPDQKEAYEKVLQELKLM